MNKSQIIQIIAANKGWRGVFISRENKDETLIVPVLCWALVADGSVVGIGILGPCEKMILDYHSDFVAYVSPDESATSPYIRDFVAIVQRERQAKIDMMNWQRQFPKDAHEANLPNRLLILLRQAGEPHGLVRSFFYDENDRLLSFCKWLERVRNGEITEEQITCLRGVGPAIYQALLEFAEKVTQGTNASN